MQYGLDVQLEEVPKKNPLEHFTHLSTEEHIWAVSFKRVASVLALSGVSDVIDLQDHFDYLGSQQDLLLLADEGLDDMLLLHV